MVECESLNAEAAEELGTKKTDVNVRTFLRVRPAGQWDPQPKAKAVLGKTHRERHQENVVILVLGTVSSVP